jgi:DNA polymerase I-like protein with 3'-5' exonuclease and polymerase domains
MTAEYLISGNIAKFMSLEDCLDEYGIVMEKTLDTKDLFASGLTMLDVPTKDLRTYVKQDVDMLIELYTAQQEYAHYKKIDIPNMDYIMALAMMEYNGLPVNVTKLCSTAGEKIGQIDFWQQEACKAVQDRFTWVDTKTGVLVPIVYPDDFCREMGTKSKTIKATANRTVSMLLTGKPEKVKITPKWDLKVTCPLMTDTQVERVAKEAKVEAGHLGYPMDEKTLGIMASWSTSTKTPIRRIIQQRKANKILNTYVMPMIASGKLQDHIYPKLHTTSTATGRLSSAEPNGQNMPKIIRQMIDGPLVEVDFSQLELVVAAAITKCPQLQADLKAGVDIHQQTALACGLQGKEGRAAAKGVNFGILYGGGKNGLAVQTGQTTATVGKLMDAFYTRYPEVKLWQQHMLTNATTKAQSHSFENGEARLKYEYREPLTGRLITFVQQKSPSWMVKQGNGKYSFSPQQLSNYPIQGMAGGTLVLEFLMALWRAIPDLKLRMTVHDSILFDLPKGWTPHDLDVIIKDILRLFKNEHHEWMIDSLNVDIDHHPEHWS